MKLAIVGATGLVGNMLLQLLAEFELPYTELILAASAQSAGKQIDYRGRIYTVVTVEEAIAQRPDIAIFSAGGSTSLHYAPLFAQVGTFVVDNSSAWRMDADKPLIVPEVNLSRLRIEDKIIANPNCSTIQLVVALAPLHRLYPIKRVVISTYQAVSGTGQKAIEQYNAERRGDVEVNRVYPHPIFQNCIPQCDVFLDNDYTKEEMKMVNETRKILADASIRITATAVRVPVLEGHSESVNVEFAQPYDLAEVKAVLGQTAGLTLLDNPSTSLYPTPLQAASSNQVFVGRLRRDESAENALNMWIVSNNLRKGAATNALQIAEAIVRKGWV